MAKIELGKVIDLIIKEDTARADALLENWFRQKTKIIHESIMEDDISQDQDEIEQEEFFGSDDLNEDEDFDDTGDASALIDPEFDEVGIEDFSTDPAAIQDQFRDVQDDIDRLEAEFKAKFGEDDFEDETVDFEEYDDTDEEIESEDEEEDDFLDDEEYDAYDDLAEALKLDTVSLADIDDEDGIEIGSGRDRIKANDRSPALQKSIDDRMSGAGPVEIRSTDVKGYPEWKKPDVKDFKLKGPIRNKDVGLSNVPRDGDPSALLNRKQEVGKTRSVLGDGDNTRNEVIRSIQRRK